MRGKWSQARSARIVAMPRTCDLTVPCTSPGGGHWVVYAPSACPSWHLPASGEGTLWERLPGAAAAAPFEVGAIGLSSPRLLQLPFLCPTHCEPPGPQHPQDGVQWQNQRFLKPTQKLSSFIHLPNDVALIRSSKIT